MNDTQPVPGSAVAVGLVKAPTGIAGFDALSCGGLPAGQRLIGNLADTERVLVGLDIIPASE
jgi:hypothetical protein